MYIFLEKYNLPRLNQEKLENMNRPIISTEIETVVKNFSSKQKPDGLTCKFYQMFREKLTSILLILFQKISEGGNPPNSFCEATITLIPKVDKYIRKKENYKPVSLMNIDVKILKKFQQTESNNILKEVGFISGMKRFFNICKSINVLCHIKKLKEKRNYASLNKCTGSNQQNSTHIDDKKKISRNMSQKEPTSTQ